MGAGSDGRRWRVAYADSYRAGNPLITATEFLSPINDSEFFSSAPDGKIDLPDLLMVHSVMNSVAMLYSTLTGMLRNRLFPS
jgi:hypothetical protein